MSVTYGQANRREYDDTDKLKMLVTAGNKQICSDIARMDFNFCHMNDNYKTTDNKLLSFFFPLALVVGRVIRENMDNMTGICCLKFSWKKSAVIIKIPA